MSCNQLSLLRRVAVEAPDALSAASWRAHLTGCAECRAARYALDRSLAVYRQVESQVRMEAAAGPSWEGFAVTLAREQRWQRLRARMQAPLAAASVFVAVGMGAVLWPSGAGLEPPPPQPAVVENDSGRDSRRDARAGIKIGDVLLREFAEAALSSAIPGASVRAGARPLGPDTARARADALAAQALRALGTQGRERQAEPFTVVSAPAGQAVRAPVLLFRSLRQQERVRRPPIQALPVAGPRMEMGTRSFTGPNPIR